MGLVVARMKNMDADLRDLTKIYREAVKPVHEMYKQVVPKDSGHMKGMTFRQATYRFGAVGLRGTGGGGGRDYVGVVEFGGTIPVPHSRQNPRLKPGHPHRRRMAKKGKPWIGGRSGTSYYLYPLWDAKWRVIVPPFVAELRKLCAKYLPK
jgi:hypothetical protein